MLSRAAKNKPAPMRRLGEKAVRIASDYFGFNHARMSHSEANGCSLQFRFPRLRFSDTQQLDVLRLIFDGNGDNGIAQILCLNEHAIKFSGKKHPGMLGTNDRTHAVIAAINE